MISSNYVRIIFTAIFDITQIAGFHSDNLYDRILLFWIFRYFKIIIPFAEQAKTTEHFY